MAKKEIVKRLMDAEKELMGEKPIMKITLKDILERSGVAKATFYKYFQDKYDFFTIHPFSFVSSQMEKLIAKEISSRELFVALSDYLYEYKYGYSKTPPDRGQNLPLDSFIYFGIEQLENYVKQAKHLTQLSYDDSLKITLFINGMVYMLFQWITDGYPLTPKDVGTILYEMCPFVDL